MNAISRNALVVAGVVFTTPTLAWTVYPDVDFEWYANVGKYEPTPAIQATPVTRMGYIWSPAHTEDRGSRQVYVAGHWVKDDYEEQRVAFNPGIDIYATGTLTTLDKDGNIISTQVR